MKNLESTKHTIPVFIAKETVDVVAVKCNSCQVPVENDDKFCRQCGQKLNTSSSGNNAELGEKKLMTIAFSDITGYTAMCEILDPEEIQELLDKIFAASKIILQQNGGVLHEIIGDCALMLFGEPKAKEDDAIRAINAINQIHQVVRDLSTPQLEAKIGRPLTLHSGVNTGQILVNKDKNGKRQIVGDPINVAARLDSIAQSDEIIINKSTYKLCKDHFNFEKLKPQNLKGKSDTMEVYRFINHNVQRLQHVNLKHRLTDMIGREKEVQLLNKSIDRLHLQQSTVISINAEAGGGKSRLCQEWLQSDLVKTFRPLRGYALSITRFNSYSLWIDFFRSLWGIEESTGPEISKSKISSHLATLELDATYFSPLLGSLLGLHYEAIEKMDAATVRQKQFNAVVSIMEALVEQEPTIFVFEDLHWADTLSLELLSHVIDQVKTPFIFLCLHRSHFKWQLQLPENSLNELEYYDIALSPFDKKQGLKMLQSLLKTSEVPEALDQFVSQRIGGNPFYMEEFVQHLIESKQLVKNGRWKITTDLNGKNIPTTIEGVVRSRIDRLEVETKRLLQQAAVIGRSFYYEVLAKVCDTQVVIKQHLERLEQSEIILEESLSQRPEYYFKHALLQEITYNSMLKNDRKQIHEKVGRTIEESFQDHLHEFYEVLAYHFKEAKVLVPAIKYAILAGKKKTALLATQEAYDYFQQAYDLLMEQGDLDAEKTDLLLDVLIEWGFVFYHMGKSVSYLHLLERHQQLIESCKDLRKKAWLYGWWGSNVSFLLTDGNRAYKLSSQAIEYAEASGDKKVIAFTYSWFASTCFYSKNIKAGEKYAIKSIEMANEFKNEKYLFGKSRFCAALCLLLNGKVNTAHRIIKEGIEIGKEMNSPRILSLLYSAMGNFKTYKKQWTEATPFYIQGGQVAPDGLYKNLSNSMATLCLAIDDKTQVAQNKMNDYLAAPGEFQFSNMAFSCAASLLNINNGKIKEGVQQMESIINELKSGDMGGHYATVLYLLGITYLKFYERKELPPLSHITNNFTFLIKFFPALGKKTKETFTELVEVSEQFEFPFLFVMGHYHLGYLAQTKNKKQLAKSHYETAINTMESLEMPDELEMVQQALAQVS